MPYTVEHDHRYQLTLEAKNITFWPCTVEHDLQTQMTCHVSHEHHFLAVFNGAWPTDSNDLPCKPWTSLSGCVQWSIIYRLKWLTNQVMNIAIWLCSMEHNLQTQLTYPVSHEHRLLAMFNGAWPTSHRLHMSQAWWCHLSQKPCIWLAGILAAFYHYARKLSTLKFTVFLLTDSSDLQLTDCE